MAQWLRIHLPMRGTRVQALVWEDPTCLGATKPAQQRKPNAAKKKECKKNRVLSFVWDILGACETVHDEQSALMFIRFGQS